jgi:hypothetical protein
VTSLENKKESVISNLILAQTVIDPEQWQWLNTAHFFAGSCSASVAILFSNALLFALNDNSPLNSHNLIRKLYKSYFRYLSALFAGNRLKLTGVISVH